MAYIWQETFSNIRNGGLVAFMSIIVVVLTIIVLSILLMVVNHVHLELSALKQSPLLVVFLEDGLQESDRQALQNQIESFPQVHSARYISKQDALRKIREIFADRKEILDGLESSNPLPTSFEVELEPQSPANARELVSRLSGIPGVEDVQYAEQTSQLVKTVETILLLISSALGLCSIAIICFSVMLTTYLRRDEIRIMRLVGATGHFIRLPLLLQGTIQGLLGSVIGLAILYGLSHLLSPRIGPIPFLPPRQIVLIVALGAFMGFTGGAFPLRRLVKI
jgi:cell division transport system permease protein